MVNHNLNVVLLTFCVYSSHFAPSLDCGKFLASVDGGKARLILDI